MKTTECEREIHDRNYCDFQRRQHQRRRALADELVLLRASVRREEVYSLVLATMLIGAGMIWRPFGATAAGVFGFGSVVTAVVLSAGRVHLSLAETAVRLAQLQEAGEWLEYDVMVLGEAVDRLCDRTP